MEDEMDNLGRDMQRALWLLLALVAAGAAGCGWVLGYLFSRWRG